MNERILAAAFQAGFINKLVSDDSYFLNNPKLEAKLKKFSELIVRECAKEAFEFWCNQVDCNEDSAQSHIKKHFGVDT